MSVIYWASYIDFYPKNTGPLHTQNQFKNISDQDKRESEPLPAAPDVWVLSGVEMPAIHLMLNTVAFYLEGRKYSELRA